MDIVVKGPAARGSFGWVVVGASALAFSSTWGAVASLGILLNDVVTELGWSRASFSGAVSMFIGVALALALAWGWAVDRWSARGVALLGGGLLGIGLFLSGSVTVPWQLYLSLGVASGVGLAAMAPVCLSLAARWFPRRPGMALGLVTGGVGVGYMVMPQVTDLLLSWGDWRFGFRALGVITWVVLGSTARFFQEPPWVPGAPAAEAPPTRPPAAPITQARLGQALRTPQFWLIAGMFVTAETNLTMVLLHLVPSAKEIGISGATAVSLVTLFGGCSIISKVGTGYLGDRVGPRRIFVPVMALQMVALVGLATGTSLWVFYPATALCGLTYGGWVPQLPSMAARAFGTRHMGAIWGALMLTSAVGAVGGPLMGGWLFDMTKAYATPYSVGAALAVLAVVPALLFRPTAPPRTQTPTVGPRR